MSRDIGDGDYDLLLQLDKYVSTCRNVYTQHRNFPLVYMFSAGQSHPLIHIHETVGNLGPWFDTILPPFQEWVMSLTSKLWLVNSILVSWVPNFHSLYSPRNDDLVHNYTYLAVLTFFSLWCTCILAFWSNKARGWILRFIFQTDKK